MKFDNKPKYDYSNLRVNAKLYTIMQLSVMYKVPYRTIWKYMKENGIPILTRHDLRKEIKTRKAGTYFDIDYYYSVETATL